MAKNAFIVTISTEEKLTSQQIARFVRLTLTGEHDFADAVVNVKKVTVSPVGEK